jgi:endonuclease/exonuclease/phosphatase family metal-dependent hydrolase
MKKTIPITLPGPVRGLFVLILVLFTVGTVCGKGKKSPEGRIKVLYWNIQNGMWSGQPDNYDRFVEWVAAYDPDVCIWAEAQSIYLDGTSKHMPAADRYLIDGWSELATRYGHGYWTVSGHRDNYPQVITSKYPVETVARIVGAEPDSVVSHGAGWSRIEFGGNTVNLVTAHLWPQGYTFGLKDKAGQDASRAENGGDKYRRMEVEYICEHTVGSVKDAAQQMWLMAGDFNSRSPFDNWFYKYPENDLRIMTQNYILQNTPYIDVIAEKYRGQFKTSTSGQSRIDYVFCTPALYDRIVSAQTVVDDYTRPVRDPEGLSNFWHPSDHLPIVFEFDFKKKR